MKNKYIHKFTDAIVTISFLYGVLHLLINTDVLSFINNEFLNCTVVVTGSIIIAVFISFAIDYLFDKWMKN
jgi:hypothetical protein